ncbi:MAG TPA: 2-C-methyl-D-erythritol 4-phosphate cytidylyltransferase [Steroidobacteraceae bacterium]|nr:2-C-methyl-D-erythritol 4-phosphate cytidylyltransferase [Steroidobacteraceae bacterium]
MPAAGVGRRFGDSVPKQYADLHGRAVIEWALAPFLADSRCAAAVVVIAASDPYWPEVARRLTAYGAVSTASGGTERSASVRNGLRALEGRAAPGDWVLVHDAARPCLPARDLDRLLGQVQSHPVGGLLASPAADTLKRAEAGGEIAATVDRAGLWRALTPQMFRFGALREALERAAAAGRTPTDEAQAIEWTGARPMVVEGSSTNIKITSADDLVIARALLDAGRHTGGAGGSPT